MFLLRTSAIFIVPFVRARWFAAAALAMLACAGCSRPPDRGTAGVTPARHAEFMPFRGMAAAIGDAVDKGDLAAARARARALQGAWRAAAPRLQPGAAPDWQALDLAIARTASAMESGPQSQAAYDAAVFNLMTAFDRAQAPATAP